MKESSEEVVCKNCHPELDSGSHPLLTMQEAEMLKRVQHDNTWGFTLLEILVVVLIIGILGAIALPQYQRAVLKSRYASMMPIAKSMADSNELYFLEHGNYTNNPQDLPVQGRQNYPDGTELEFGTSSDYSYVLATRGNNFPNNYIVYQKHSGEFPGEIHCEALKDDELAEGVCKSFGASKNIGTTLTSTHDTWVLEGQGNRIPSSVWDEMIEDEEDNNTTSVPSCDKAIEQQKSCTLTEKEDGITKRVCYTANDASYPYCMVSNYDIDNHLTSKTICAKRSDTRCDEVQKKIYDEDGNEISLLACQNTESDGSCKTYIPRYYYSYDEYGNKTKKLSCGTVSADGSCTQYNGLSMWKYDKDGNMISERKCSSNKVSSDGKSCTEYNYTYAYDYTYENGRITSKRHCCSMNADGSCKPGEYCSVYEYTYDDAKRIRTEQSCSDSQVTSEGTCSSYRADSFTYTLYDEQGHVLVTENASLRGTENRYDERGNLISSKPCNRASVEAGKCVYYSSSGTFYTYDANNNITSELTCRILDDGSCFDRTSGHIYTYDTDGTITDCTCNYNPTPTKCGATCSGIHKYIIDEYGNKILTKSCTGDSVRTNCASSGYGVDSSLTWGNEE